MNPYASFLGDRNAQETIAATTARLNDIAAKLGPAGAERKPAPHKWNAREIVSHLADCEIVFAFRLRQTQAEPGITIQPFDQDRWSASYAAYDLASALAVFAAVRAWNIALIRSLPPEAFSKEFTHPERGTMTFQTLVETMGGHDLNHLKQLDAIVAAA
ncbi:MAG TPA: DinB family protein [Bryobacteraceae bacterium]|nr:DinB family protein [Bryobacteraceae bacterium]